MSGGRRWLTENMIVAMHAAAIARFGGETGIRDQGLLEGALARPHNREVYSPGADVFALAADYCFGIVSNHPFVDGNKRAGLLAARVFLTLNGCDFHPDEADTVQVIVGVAARAIDVVALSAWLRDNSSPLH